MVKGSFLTRKGKIENVLKLPAGIKDIKMVLKVVKWMNLFLMSYKMIFDHGSKNYSMSHVILSVYRRNRRILFKKYGFDGDGSEDI